MLLNLLSNAHKFTSPGGRVTIHAGHDRKSGCTLSITDTGIGIDPSDVSFILAPFTQRNTVETATEGGTGLGLPSVKSLIELHNGSIDIKSRPGDGTKVTLSFPEPSNEQLAAYNMRRAEKHKVIRYQ